MTKKTRLIIRGGILALLAAAVVYVYLPDSSSAAAADDARKLESLRHASEEAKASAPPAEKFNELPVKPSDGTREVHK